MPEFEGIFGRFLVQPIYHLLMLLIGVLPGHSLALAIILLTIGIRFLLYLPMHKSLRQQTTLQQLQPKIKEVREKYKHDQQLLAKKTMELYKEHGVNPFGSCLPLLIQLPILIAVYRVLLMKIQFDGLNPFFFGVDLSTVESIFFPITVGVTQFISMKLMSKAQKAKIHDVTPQERNEPPKIREQERTMGMMTYIMPLLIIWIARSLPAGLSLYWITSTLFGIGQQFIIARQENRRPTKSAN